MGNSIPCLAAGFRNQVNALIAIFLCIGLAACYSIQTKDWGQWAEEGLAEPGSTTNATFGWNDWPGMIVSIDRHAEVATGYKSARLRPGRHVIEYSNYVHDFGHVKGELQLVLVVSHEYEFRFATCYWCMPRRFAVWIDDLTTGEVAWGTRPNWPHWYLRERSPTADKA